MGRTPMNSHGICWMVALPRTRLLKGKQMPSRLVFIFFKMDTWFLTYLSLFNCLFYYLKSVLGNTNCKYLHLLTGTGLRKQITSSSIFICKKTMGFLINVLSSLIWMCNFLKFTPLLVTLSCSWGCRFGNFFGWLHWTRCTIVELSLGTWLFSGRPFPLVGLFRACTN